MNSIGTLLIIAVVSVVPGFFVWVFANSAYASLRKYRQRLREAEHRLTQASPAEASARRAECDQAQAAYDKTRRTFWGTILGALCQLPPANNSSRR